MTRSFRFTMIVWLAAIGVAAIGAKVCAQCGGESEPAKPDPAKLQPKKVGTVQPVAASDTKGAGPRWVCDKPVVTIDPVWRGEPMLFKFDFRNDGTENLTLKLKGG